MNGLGAGVGGDLQDGIDVPVGGCTLTREPDGFVRLNWEVVT